MRGLVAWDTDDKVHVHLGICAGGVGRLGGSKDQAVVPMKEFRDMIPEDSFDAVRQLLLLEDDPAYHQASGVKLSADLTVRARLTRTADSRGLRPALFSGTFCTARRQSWRDATAA